MEIWKSFSLNEKLASGLFLLFCPVYWIAHFTVLPNLPSSWEALVPSLVWLVSWLLAIGVSSVLAIAAWASKPNVEHSWGRQVIGRVLPIVSLAFSLALTWAIADRVSLAEKRAFAEKHDALLVGVSPKAVIYSEGVPDGGYVVVRSPRDDPTTFSQTQMIALTGERIKSCEKLSDTDWICRFD